MKKKRMLVVLALCLLVLTSLPVLAATNDCSHNWNSAGSSNSTVKSLDANYHETTQVISEECSWCTATRTVTVVEKANHSIVYDDLGHGSQNHNYLRRCTKCNYSQYVTIGCWYEETGSHQKP